MTRATCATLWILGWLLGVGCTEQPTAPEIRANTVEVVLARERAAAHFAAGRWADAGLALAPLLEGDRAPEDLIRAANVALAGRRPEDAAPLLEEALATKGASRDPALHWALLRLARSRGALAEAEAHAAAVRRLAPEDIPARLVSANLLAELDRVEEAEEQYVELLERGPALGGGWLIATLEGYGELLVRNGRAEEAADFLDEHRRLTEAGLDGPAPEALERGSFGDVAAARPGAVDSPAAWEAALGPTAAWQAGLASEASLPVEGISGVFGCALRDAAGGDEDLSRTACSAEALVAYGPGGLRILRRASDGQLQVETVLAEATQLAVAADLRRATSGPELAGATSATELLAVTAEGLLLLEQTDTGWRRARSRPLLTAFPVSDVTPVDFDHDGDLDLLAVGERGVRLLRNDGTALTGPTNGFVEGAVEAGLPAARPFSWCTTEDLDRDGAVDLVLGGEGHVFVAHNERGGRFGAATRALPEEATEQVLPAFADLAADSWTDVILAGPSVDVFRGGPRGRWTRQGLGAGPRTALGPHALRVHDLFHTGRPVLLWPEPERGLMWLDPEGRTRSARELSGARPELAPRCLALADLDGDGKQDLVESDGRNLRAHLVRDPGHAVRLSLRGVEDNRRGLGAVVEVRAGPMYRRFFWRGRSEDIGLGLAERLDVVRVTWPNGVVQTELDLAGSGCWQIRQRSPPAAR